MPDIATPLTGMSPGIILVIILAVIIEMGLAIWALLDLFRREHVRGNKKIIWVLVILLCSTIGPIIYFLVGRSDGPTVDSSKIDDDEWS
ncbi:MAG: PLD nuclease N-terminal domain-containing protein [Dehalococcoidia bacterium]|nr:PLD nuclease N-terminal domain-containing protein [Dehalococcoidia bacterium]